MREKTCRSYGRIPFRLEYKYALAPRAGEASNRGNPHENRELFRTDGTQAVKLPDGFHFEGDTVSIRREGEAVILEPLKPSTWPPGFFDHIRIDDPAFARPKQGSVPPAPSPD